MAVGAVGGVIVGFGWYGFVRGSPLSRRDFEGLGRVATNTTLAASAAGLLAMFVAYPRAHKWDTGIAINGFLSGLVAVTCPCFLGSPFRALWIGARVRVVLVLRIHPPQRLLLLHPLCR